MTEPNGANDDLLAAAVTCLAGPLARQRSAGTDRFELVDGDDLATAHHFLSKLGLAGIAGIKSILPFTRHLVEDEWPAISLLARELVARKTLDYDEVVALLRPHN